MGAIGHEKMLKELRSRADKWIEERLPERMQSVGVEESEVRRQLEIEAEEWVQYNLEQRSQGKAGTPSPDALIEGEGALDPSLRGPKREKLPEF